MLRVKFDTRNFNKIMQNSINYSKGFFEGIEMEKIQFNRVLAGYTVEALGKYIDSKARINPNALHHVYEWGMVGNQNGRLFKFNPTVTINFIKINGSFLSSKTTPPNSDYIFYDKASIMESGVSLTIEPKNSSMLVFEDNGETVFTASPVYVAHPGGTEVAGSFAHVVDEFFNVYFTNALIKPIMNDLQNVKEFVNNFNAGANGGGRNAGIRAGRQYFNISGVVIE